MKRMHRGEVFIELQARFLEYEAAKGVQAKSDLEFEILEFIADNPVSNYDGPEPDYMGPEPSTDSFCGLSGR